MPEGPLAPGDSVYRAIEGHGSSAEGDEGLFALGEGGSDSLGAPAQDSLMPGDQPDAEIPPIFESVAWDHPGRIEMSPQPSSSVYGSVPPESPSQSSQTPAPGRSRPAIEQQRRTTLRENIAQLAELVNTGRDYGARALGLQAGAGTGAEEEDLDDRTDKEEDLSLCFDEATLQRRQRNARRRARSRAQQGQGRGRGRGRGGSAGGAGSKSAVLFQTADLLYWLEVRNQELQEEIAAMSAVLEGH